MPLFTVSQKICTIKLEELLGIAIFRGPNAIGTVLKSEGFRMYWSDDLECSKEYIRGRYDGMKKKRYGIIASSRDNSLSPDIPNDFMSTKNVRKGAWYNEEQSHERSCCNLQTCMTEFGVQGLELDFCLIGWGTD